MFYLDNEQVEIEGAVQVTCLPDRIKMFCCDSQNRPNAAIRDDSAPPKQPKLLKHNSTEKCTVQGGWVLYPVQARLTYLSHFLSFIWFQNMASSNKTLNPRGSCKEECGAIVEFVHLAALPRRRRMRRVARCAAATEYRPAGHANNRTARMCAKKSRPKIASLCL